MGLREKWETHVLPLAVDLALAEPTAGRWRRRVVADVAGEVLEVGFGSGRTLPYYPDAVCRVLAVEPALTAWERATGRIADFGRPVVHVGLDGARLEVADASVDAVVSSWTMCTIPDLGMALSEFSRVLRPGGRLHFVEHSLAPTSRTAAIQRRVQPVWGAVAGGCHLDRDIPRLLDAAGFDVDLRQERFVADGPARVASFFVLGTATPGAR
ncbi:MAG: methyltransferase domain-containing protein [Micrococcales bacterium]|nr:methyltransferase domain-containing protein [Micrococcales bacterium]